MEKIKRSVTLSQDIYDYINEYKDSHHMNFSAALDEIINEHRLSLQDKKNVQGKEDEMMKRLTLRLGFIDKNVGVLLDVLNSILYGPSMENLLYVPSDQVKHPLIESAEKNITDKIARQKQIKDNGKKKKQVSNLTPEI